LSVKFGVTLPQFTQERERFLYGARRAEQLGYDSVWVFDHLWPLSGGRERPVLEAWMALSYLATATERIGIGTLVTRSSLRHPVVLAKMVATVGELAPGRVICAVGSGDKLSRAENVAFGIAYFENEDRINQLASTLELLTAYTSEGVVSHTDGFLHVEELVTSPRPDPAPEIWVGGGGRSVLDLAGEGADGWNRWGIDVARFERAARTVSEAAGERGIEISWAGQVMVADSDEAARTKLAKRDAAQFVAGGPETVAAQLARFIQAGATHLIAAFPDAGDPESYELFAESVIPLLRGEGQYP
jgi:alkanesulfonate monooxygenase SsuD/methylene tetrahydromethanopterin reductase-like flavin-dependent oxidoreductase (luciferase family)